MTAGRMEFRVLGPLQVIASDGSVVALGPRQANILAVLLLAPDEVAGVPRLVDALWGDDPPATARHQVQNGIWLLRQHIPILSDGRGYRLSISEHGFDLRTFEEQMSAARAMAGAGQSEAALRQARDALKLWRGPALMGCSGWVVEAGASRLDEQRLVGQEFALELQLELGRHHEAAAGLAELVQTHPTRERLVGLHMRALVGSGRPADALEAFHTLRGRLAEELGVDPGPELQTLYAAIMKGTPPPGPAPAGPGPRVPRQLPAVPRTFVGRAKELEELDALLRPRDRGAGDRGYGGSGRDGGSAGEGAAGGPVAAICGAAGVGKTTLAVRWAQQISPNFPDGQLYLDLRGYDPTGAPMPSDEALRDLLVALGVGGDRIPMELSQRAAEYRSLLAGRRMLIVLDNAAGAEQIRPLLPGPGDNAVVVTSRDQLTGLVAQLDLRPINLDVLSHDDARDLLNQRLGRDRVDAEPAATDDLIVQCGRLPLALAIVAARAAASPGTDLAGFAAQLHDNRPLSALDTGDPVAQVRTALSWSYRRLSAPAAQLLRLLGVHPGLDITAPAAASLLATSLSAVRPLLAELVQVSLLVERPPGRYTAHDLVRAYSIELSQTDETQTERDPAIHRILDYYLHSANSAVILTEPSRQPIAIPLEPPTAGITPDTFTDRAAAVAWLDAEALTLFAATHQAYRLGLDLICWQLSWTLSRRLLEAGRWIERVEIQATGLAAARRMGEPNAEAYTRQFLAMALVMLSREDDAYAHYLAALAIYEESGDRLGQANVHVNIGGSLERLGRFEDALSHAEKALALFREVGRRRGIADSLNAVGWYAICLGRYEYGLAHCTEALAMCDSPDYAELEPFTLDSIGTAQHRLGNLDEAVSAYTRSIEGQRRTRNMYFSCEPLIKLGDLRHEQGRDDLARECWHEAWTILTELGHPDADDVQRKLAALD
jgi:DNA-binding SARP family transcriptional activator/tetratricopeptide (TPR) repeat protein